MIKLTLRKWHTLAVLLSVTAFARALPLDAAVSAAPDPYEATVFDTATGATCADGEVTAGRPRSAAFAAADPSAPLAVTAMEIHFVSDTSQALEDVRVRVQFSDSDDPVMGGMSAHPARVTREATLGARQYEARSVNSATIRFEHPVTLTAAPMHAVSFDLQSRAGGVWTDTAILTPCLQSTASSRGRAPVLSPNAAEVESVAMVKIFGAWLSPPPTLPPIPKPTNTPTPAPPLALVAFVPAVQR